LNIYVRYRKYEYQTEAGRTIGCPSVWLENVLGYKNPSTTINPSVPALNESSDERSSSGTSSDGSTFKNLHVGMMFRFDGDLYKVITVPLLVHSPIEAFCLQSLGCPWKVSTTRTFQDQKDVLTLCNKHLE
jgi:hypothetical protein